MTREQLQDRITKKETEITKIEKRIAKWSKGLRPEDIAVCEPFGNCTYDDSEFQPVYQNYKNYINTRKDIPSSDDWNKGPNIGELYSAYRDLGEARHTLEKYKNQLTNLDKFEGEEKIEVIWKFLQDWREMAYNYYVEEIKEYIRLRKNYKEAWEAFKNSIDYEDQRNSYNNYRWADYEIESKFKAKYYKNVDSLAKQLYEYGDKWDDAKLNKILDEELRRKYTKLVHDVTSKAGEIVDASNLKINARGEINGRIKGTKNDVDLWLTLVNGDGEGIQCPHYRGYCNVAK